MVRTWKTYRLLLCMMMLIAAFPVIHAQAQIEEGWEYGCDSAAIPAIAATTSQLDYEAMCHQYLECGGGPLCLVEVSLNAESACEDNLCQSRVRLYSVAMAIFDQVTMLRSPGAGQLPDLVLTALDAFEAADYTAAQEAYLSVPYEVAFHPFLTFSVGLVADASGDNAGALTIYDESATQTETYPFVFYVRGDMFARLGQVEAAGADFATFEDYVAADPELTAIASQLAADYPISDLTFEDWQVYPVLYSGGGPGGGWAYDETLTEPSAFRLAYIEDGARLVVEGVPPGVPLFDFPPPRYMLMSQDEDGNYQTAMMYTDDYGVWGVDVTLDLSSGIGMQSTLVFESGTMRYYLIAPEGQPDPREQFDVFRCEGGAITRLTVGAQGYLAGFDGAALTDQPAGEATGEEIERFSGFIVLQGPECVGDQVWWQVESDSGAVGWIAENEGIEYRLLTNEAVPIPPLH